MDPHGLIINIIKVIIDTFYFMVRKMRKNSSGSGGPGGGSGGSGGGSGSPGGGSGGPGGGSGGPGGVNRLFIE